MATETTNEPTTGQLIAAFGQALLPLAGPGGVVASSVMTAGLAFLQGISASGKKTITMADLEAIAATTTANLDAFGRKVDALPKS